MAETNTPNSPSSAEPQVLLSDEDLAAMKATPGSTGGNSTALTVSTGAPVAGTTMVVGEFVPESGSKSTGLQLDGYLMRLSQNLSGSTLVPPELRNKPQDVLMILQTGQELGLAPTAAIRGVYLVKGRPTLAALTLAALAVKRKDICKYIIYKETSSTRAVVETWRVGHPSATTTTWTMEDAKLAGLLTNKIWLQYPKQMLRARAVTDLVRMVYPEVSLGLYASEDFDAASPETVFDEAPLAQELAAQLRLATELSTVDFIIAQIKAANLPESQLTPLRDLARTAKIRCTPPAPQSINTSPNSNSN